MNNKIFPCLWFDREAEEAAKFYTSVFRNSKIITTTRYDASSAKAAGLPEGTVMTVIFELDGMQFMALNGGPLFKFSEAISFVVNCKDQEEIDYYWKALSAHPENEQCGWLKDKFGLSWQIVPGNLGELITSPKATAKLMDMKKIVIDELKNAQ